MTDRLFDPQDATTDAARVKALGEMVTVEQSPCQSVTALIEQGVPKLSFNPL